jgi:Ca2+-binding EF-hand superfamily protein
MNLTQEEVTQCRRAFASFDTDRSGSIDMEELQAILTAMRITIDEDELTRMIAGVTESMTGISLLSLYKYIQNV